MPIALTSGTSGGGGGTPGASIMRGPFSFAYDTPGLTTGVEVYAPSDGEILLFAFPVVDTLWNGTTPQLDVGTFVGTTSGFTASVFPLVANYPIKLDDASVVQVSVGDGVYPVMSTYETYIATEYEQTYVFDGTETLKVVVSQDATSGGADPGATQGAARLYIVTATPVAL